MKIKVGISNRHVHLTEEVYKILFKDTKMEVVKPLSQTGEFASNLTVTIKTEKNKIERVRVVGPLRKYNQVEISKTDAYTLGLNPPVRMSGDLDNSETITIVTENAEVTLENACIIAARHIHATKEDYEKYNLSDIMKAYVEGEKRGVMGNIEVKCHDSFVFELHIDTDDANAFMLKSGDELEIESDL